LHHAAGSQRVNYGSVLSLWDSVLGTLTFSGQRKALEFGIDERRKKATL
jgi:sterol desaturase/sphingolipid hydroxylase (fatty acid hydroxylase superfamily)